MTDIVQLQTMFLSQQKKNRNCHFRHIKERERERENFWKKKYFPIYLMYPKDDEKNQ